MDETALLACIEDCIMQGDSDEITDRIREGIEQGITPKTIVENALLAGMSKMGRLFRDNEVYVPDVILAASAMQAGLDMLKPMLMERHSVQNKTIIIGTVQNDLHDLGKTIISCSLTAAGFDVIDLGINVPASAFIRALKEEKPCILALSCTLSYTLSDLKSIVEEVRRSVYAQDVKIIVGGLSVTPAFAASIGADAYSLNADHIVLMANRLLND